MPGTIHCTGGWCSATADPGTHCGGGGGQSHEDTDPELYPGMQLVQVVSNSRQTLSLGDFWRAPIAQASLDATHPPPTPIIPVQGAYQMLQSSWMVALGGYHCPP